MKLAGFEEPVQETSESEDEQPFSMELVVLPFSKVEVSVIEGEDT